MPRYRSEVRGMFLNRDEQFELTDQELDAP